MTEPSFRFICRRFSSWRSTGRVANPSLLAFALSFSVPVAAQTTVIPETPGIPGGALWQLLFGLALILGLLFLFTYLMRRFNGGRAFGNTGPLRVVGGLMIGPRERIVLVEIDDTWLVIGIVPGQIKTLHTLPKGELPVNNAGEQGFGIWLKHMTERKHDNG